MDKLIVARAKGLANRRSSLFDNRTLNRYRYRYRRLRLRLRLWLQVRSSLAGNQRKRLTL